jgi:glycosyltransferase involved in cell wall biosynthesis
VDFEKEGIRTVSLKAVNRYDLRFNIKNIKLIAEERPDIVHTHLPRADLAGAFGHFFYPSIPWVCSVHDIHDQSWAGRWALPLFDHIWHRADRVIAISHAVKEWLVNVRSVPREKISVIHYGIEVDRFAYSVEDLREQWGLHEKFIIGAIGRLESRKGHDCLIRAMSELKKLVPNACLLIAGHDPFGYGKQLRSLINELNLRDEVRLVGFQTDIAAFLGALDVFAFATHSEGFGQVLIEAMAAGKPVIASNIAPLTEIVRNAETGLLVEPDDPFEFTRALAWVLDDFERAENMARRGQESARSHFSAPRMVEETITVYEELLKLEHDRKTVPHQGEDMS